MSGFTVKIKLVGHAGCHINLFFYHTRMEVKFKADLRQRQADGAQTSLKIFFVSEPAVFPQRLLGSSLLPWVKSLHGNMAGPETKKSWEMFVRHCDRMNACIFNFYATKFTSSGLRLKLCTMPNTWGTIAFILMKPATSHMLVCLYLQATSTVCTSICLCLYLQATSTVTVFVFIATSKGGNTNFENNY